MIDRRTLLQAAALGGITAWLPRGSLRITPAVKDVIFVAHPDDATLGMGEKIVRDLTAGHDIHVVTLSQGGASGVIRDLNGERTNSWWGRLHYPAQEGYEPLSVEQFMQARVNESIAATKLLGAGLPGSLSLYYGDLPDGAITFATAYGAMLGWMDAIAPTGQVRIKCHTPLPDLEDHPDHRAIGNAAMELRVDFPDRVIETRYFGAAGVLDPDMVGITPLWENPANADAKQQVINSCRAYGAWVPNLGAYAVGWHSVYSTMFVPLMTTARCLYHVL